MANYIASLHTANPSFFNPANTATILAPLVTAMKLEGSYWLKPPCYNHNIINDYDPTCLHGSPWNA
jgi:hypothetical protein